MIVYHGSNIIVDKPNISFSRKELDFSCGFYLTTIYEQAEKWSKRKLKDGMLCGVVNKYELDEEIFNNSKVLKFETYSTEWLDFISKCRRGKDDTDYDVVMGGIANDKVFDTIELYFDGLISKDEAIGKLKYETINNQICIRKQNLIDKYLKFEGTINGK